MTGYVHFEFGDQITDNPRHVLPCDTVSLIQVHHCLLKVPAKGIRENEFKMPGKLTHLGHTSHMARQCQASLPWHHHVATPARSTYLASAATWRQKHWSYTPRGTLKYCIFLFVDIAEIGTVSALSYKQNEAYIGFQLKPETLTWPDPANVA